MSVPVILLTATTLIALIWIADVFGDDIKRWWTARQDLRRHNNQEKAHKALIEECFQESLRWEERKLERDRRYAEREARRQDAA
jgi:hypothetical protein